jgi:hypothetical protein
MYGGRAYAWSFSTGLLFTMHPPAVKGFTISPFAQFGFNHDHGRLTIPMGDGIYWKDGVPSATPGPWAPASSALFSKTACPVPAHWK